MCFDRLRDEETVEASLPAVLAAEWRCALRNGAMAAAIVVAVLLVDGTAVGLVLGSAAGAIVLGTVLHQIVLLTGWGVLRARARWRGDRAGTAT
jgi:hypothetical protein